MEELIPAFIGVGMMLVILVLGLLKFNYNPPQEVSADNLWDD